MRSSFVTRVTTVAAAALVLAACGTDGEEPRPSSEEPGIQSPAESPEGQPGPDTGALADPNDLVRDGAFRGEGLVIPALDGWSFDELAYQQGMIVAVTEDGRERFVGLPIPTDDLPEGQELDYQLLLDDLQDLPDATVDEDVTIDGATQARQLRFEDVPGQSEGQEPSTELLVAADDGDGLLAIFNYNADADAFDDDRARAFLEGIGFDPDSRPTPVGPAAPPAP